MVRWIAFDDETAEAVVCRYKRGAAEIREGEEPLDAALRLRQPSILILPAPVSDRVLLVGLEPKKAAAELAFATKGPVRYQAAGFLGLRDEPVFEEPAPPKKKKERNWWRKRAA